MEDPFSLDRFSQVLNLSSALQPGWSLNRSSSLGDRWPSLNRQMRVISAGTILLLGLVGNCLVLHRLCCGCCGRGRRRRKMDFLIAHLALADLYGCGLALLSHLTAELLGVAWPAADTTCRLLKLLQGSGPLASSNVLVLIALERHHVVRQPAVPPLPARTLAALGWLLALLLALPQAFVFRLVSRPGPGGSRCLSIFEQLPRWHGQAYGAYGAVTSFLAPVCLLCWAYGRILLALWAAQEEKSPAERGEGSGRRRLGLPAARPLLLRLPPAASCPMPRARVKTLQLTLVLIALFALCRLPRFVLELSLAFGPGEEAPTAAGLREARAALAIVAVTNSALNPYAYLLFQSHRPWARRVQRSLCRAGPSPTCCCCFCPGPEGEPRPRRRPNHRAQHRHRPKDGPPPGVQRSGSGSPALPPGSGPAELEAATSACESGF